MVEIPMFAHGHHYGDYSGVIFRGSGSKSGCHLGQLAISNCYIHPLFYAILDQMEKEKRPPPRFVSQWNLGKGWADTLGELQVSYADLTEFSEALSQLRSADLFSCCDSCTKEECMRCAMAIREFIDRNLESGAVITVEED